MRRQHVERAQVLDEAVGQRRIELQAVAVRPQAAVADQVARVLHREQVLAGGERRRVARRQRRVQQIVERIERLLVPAQAVGRDRVAAGHRLVEIEAAVDVDRQPSPVPPTIFSTASMRLRSSASGTPPIFIFTQE